MATARLDGLVMNDSKVMRQENDPTTCPLCGSGNDNVQHAWLHCRYPEMEAIRGTLDDAIESILKPKQLAELNRCGDHDKKMTLLGRQLHRRLSLKQQRDLDTAVKISLESMDDYRVNKKSFNPMCGRTHTRPPDSSLQQAALWNRTWKEHCHRLIQGLEDPAGADEPSEWTG